METLPQAGRRATKRVWAFEVPMKLDILHLSGMIMLALGGWAFRAIWKLWPSARRTGPGTPEFAQIPGRRARAGRAERTGAQD